MLPAHLDIVMPAAARLKILALGLLALAAAAGLGAVAGYRHGVDVERGRHAIGKAATLERAAQDARALTAAESDRRQAAALHDAHVAAAARAARIEGQAHALQTARPDDRHLSADHLVRLEAAIGIANHGTATAAGSLHGPVPNAAQPARPGNPSP
ncbi:hypothetical protein [Thauera propionica]|uniref:hypothetical protein n=1 Tax=Thauera propionica TaxID=2019431 RepID=UPI001055AF02|nr:hypothetical protein [Thauera propionica]